MYKQVATISTGF